MGERGRTEGGRGGELGERKACTSSLLFAGPCTSCAGSKKEAIDDCTRTGFAARVSVGVSLKASLFAKTSTCSTVLLEEPAARRRGGTQSHLQGRDRLALVLRNCLLNISTLQCSKSFHLCVMLVVSIRPLTGGLALGFPGRLEPGSESWRVSLLRASRCDIFAASL